MIKSTILHNWGTNSHFRNPVRAKRKTEEESSTEFGLENQVLRFQNHFEVVRTKIPQLILPKFRNTKFNWTLPNVQNLTRIIGEEEKKDEKIWWNWKWESENLPSHDEMKEKSERKWWKKWREEKFGREGEELCWNREEMNRNVTFWNLNAQKRPKSRSRFMYRESEIKTEPALFKNLCFANANFNLRKQN